MVIIFDTEVEESMIALINMGGEYTRVSFDQISGDFLTAHDFSLVEELEIRGGEIHAYLPFDMSRLVSSIQGTNSTLLQLNYLENALKITQLLGAGTIGHDSKIAHVRERFFTDI